MLDSLITLECFFPNDLIKTLVGPDRFSQLKGYDVVSAARGVLDFLHDQDTEIYHVTGKKISNAEYHAILPGATLQIRLSQVFLDSVRDWIVLSVVLASVLKDGQDIPMAVLGAAIASFVRSMLGSIHRLDERTGERCIIKLMIGSIKESGRNRSIDRDEMARAIESRDCLSPECKYRQGNTCSLQVPQLDALLEHMEKRGVIRKVGADAYKLPW